MQSKTLTNRSHLALFRYAVSHPYLFSAVSRTHWEGIYETHFERLKIWISFSLPLLLQLLYQQSRTPSLLKKLAKWSGTKEQYIWGLRESFNGTDWQCVVCQWIPWNPWNVYKQAKQPLDFVYYFPYYPQVQVSCYALEIGKQFILYIHYWINLNVTYHFKPFHISWTS